MYRHGIFEDITKTNVKQNNLSLRQGKDLEIYLILRDPAKELDRYPSTETISTTWNPKRYRYQNFNFIEIPDHAFFNQYFIDELFFEENSDLSYKIFIFESTQWKVLVNTFKKIGVVLSGGSSVKRHVLSPVQMKLSRFLFLLEGWKKSYDNTKTSFFINNIMNNYNLLNN